MDTVLCVSSKSLPTRISLLKSSGYEVLIATNECASLAVGRLSSVDAVILDSCSSINLLAIARELKRERPSLPILLVTDAGVEDVPEPSSAFDRIISRLDGPAVLLGTLRELMVGVVSIGNNHTVCGGDV